MRATPQWAHAQASAPSADRREVTLQSQNNFLTSKALLCSLVLVVLTATLAWRSVDKGHLVTFVEQQQSVISDERTPSSAPPFGSTQSPPSSPTLDDAFPPIFAPSDVQRHTSLDFDTPCAPCTPAARSGSAADCYSQVHHRLWHDASLNALTLPSLHPSWAFALVLSNSSQCDQRRLPLFFHLEHYVRRDEEVRISNTRVSNISKWNDLLKHTTGPDELRIEMKVCFPAEGTPAHLPAVTQQRLCIDSRPHALIPLGTKYLGFTSDRRHSYVALLGSPQLVKAIAAQLTQSTLVPSHSFIQMDLTITHEYDEYWAVNDVQSTALRHVHRQLSRDYSIAAALDVSPSAHRPIAFCRGEADERAIYVKHSPSVPKASMNFSVRGADFAATGISCSYDLRQSREAGALLRSLSRRVASASRSRKSDGFRILFTGDSQIRTIFRHWVSVVDNEPPVQQKTFNATIFHTSAGSARSTFLWDAYLKHLMNDVAIQEMIAAEYDALVVGFGSWPASFGQWSFETMELQLRRLTKCFELLLDAGVTIVWAGSPAWPKHRKDTPNFRITNSRLFLFNSIAKKELVPLQQTSHRSSLKFLPFYDLSISMSRLRSKDGMHYDGSVVLYSCVDALATFLFSTP